MLKILQASFQQYMNCERPDFQAGFTKAGGNRVTASILWITEKQESSRKTSTFALLIMPKPLTVLITQLWKILQEIRIPDHLTCILRNLYAGQEATVRTGHGATDFFQIGEGLHQGCILTPCLSKLYVEYINEMSGWMKHKLESKLLGEILITSDTQTT